MVADNEFTRSPARPVVTERVPTLRDQFAMAALTGLLAAPDLKDCRGPEIVEAAWEYANAMMKARDA